ncbi:MAG: serpin family protein [Bacillota bacterium]|nr:serpin family protein [Bacillota bacterium]
MKNFRKLTAILLIMTFAAVPVFAADAQSAGVVINGGRVDFSAPPVVENGRTLVALGEIAKALGAGVTYENETAVIILGDKSVSFTAGENFMVANGEKVPLDITLDTNMEKTISNSTRVPLRAVAEALGYTVKWNEEEFAAYVDGKKTEFADKLNALMPQNENYMFSPLSIKMALGLLACGAEGETLQEILCAVDEKSADTLNENSKAQIDKYTAEGILKLSVANSVWLNESRSFGAKFSDEYINAVKTYYSAESNTVNNDDAVNKINSWVNDKTNGKIPSIISDNEFAACLINAIYFKGAWLYQFDKDKTSEDTFTNLNGEEKKIPFMDETEHMKYYEDGGVQIISMPYSKRNDATDENGKLINSENSKLNIAMCIVLPKDGKQTDVAALIKNAKMSSEKVHVRLPKFKTEYSTSLKDIFKTLGINKAFSENAQFDKMKTGGSENFFVSDAIHKTYINVDENGTEAAAVTAIMVGATSIQVPDIIREFNANKPFYYAIVDTDNNEILFMGRYCMAK